MGGGRGKTERKWGSTNLKEPGWLAKNGLGHSRRDKVVKGVKLALLRGPGPRALADPPRAWRK